jgi:hypothetical protein
MAVRIVRHTFEIIHLLTGEVNNEQRERENIDRCLFRIHCKYWSMRSLTVDPVKIPHVSVELVLSDDKPSMSHLFDE